MTELNWRTLTQQSLALPYGRARTTGLEKALDLAIRGGATEEDVFHLRMSLTEAYKYGGEPARAMTTFTRCLTAFDADPARYGPEAHHRLLWQFKWMTDFPEIPLDRTYALLDDMERRYRESGYSLHPVHGLRCQVARHIGDVATADAEFERWRTAPQDESSDCAGCVPTAMAFHLAWRGAHAEAIAIAEPVLSGELTCVEQPQGILSALIEPYLRTGRYEAAVDAHRRTYRVRRRYETRYLFSLGTHLFFCAVTGNHARGLELLERHLGALDAPPSPMDAMEFAASAALLLDRLAACGHGDLTVRRPAHQDRPAAELRVTELRDQMRDHALALAARFDARNGTTAQSTRIRDRLAAEPVVAELPLTEYVPRPRPAAASPEPLPEPLADTWQDLLDQAEQWRRTWRKEQARAAWRRFDELTVGVELPSWARGRRAEAEGWFHDMDGDHAAAVEHYRAAADHYAAAQLDADRHRVLSLLGQSLAEDGNRTEGLALLQQAVAYLDEHGTPTQRVGARIRLAAHLMFRGELAHARKLLEESGYPDADATARAQVLLLLATISAATHAPFPEQEALLAQARREARDSGSPRLVVEAACRHAQLLRASGQDAWDAAWQALEEAEAHLIPDLPPGAETSVLLTRGQWLCEDQEYEQAAVVLAEAVAQATALGIAPMAAHAKVLLARAYHAIERYFEAAEAAEEILAAEQHLVSVDRKAVREILARSLGELGELEDALARWDEIIAMEDDPAQTAVLHVEAARVLSRMGRHAEAAERHAATAVLWEELDEPYQVYEQHYCRAVALLLAHRVADAHTAHQQAEQWLKRAEAHPELRIPAEHLKNQRGLLHHSKARIMAAEGLLTAAVAEAEKAYALFREVDEQRAAEYLKFLARMREAADEAEDAR